MHSSYINRQAKLGVHCNKIMKKMQYCSSDKKVTCDVSSCDG